jgi:hypothetical protein
MFGSKAKKIKELESTLRKSRLVNDALADQIEDLRTAAMGVSKHPAYRGLHKPFEGAGTEHHKIHNAIQRLVDSGVLTVKNGRFVRD